MRCVAVIVVGACLSLVTPAFAQQAKPAKSVKKDLSFDYSGDNVDGEIVRPFLESDFIPKDRKRESLLKLRTSFVPEILKAANDQ